MELRRAVNERGPISKKIKNHALNQVGWIFLTEDLRSTRGDGNVRADLTLHSIIRTPPTLPGGVDLSCHAPHRGGLFLDLQIGENTHNHEFACSPKMGHAFSRKKKPAGRSWGTKTLKNTIEIALSRNQTIPSHIPSHILPFGAIYEAISMKKQPGLD